MEYRQFGRSGLKVSALAVSTATFGRNDPAKSVMFLNGAKEARRLFNLCFDAGVNLVDTADAYGGASEQIVGEVLEGRRSDVLIENPMAVDVRLTADERTRLDTVSRLPSPTPIGISPPTTAYPRPISR